MSLSILLALLLAPGCLEVVDARITAGHLKTIVPEFAPIADSAEFGYAPAPGTTRWIRRAELSAFSGRHGIVPGHLAELCVTRGAQALTAESVESAIRRSLDRLVPNEKVSVEIIDYVRLPLPRGEIVFSARDLHSAPQGALLWRGRVEYDRNRSVPVWVKAKILVDRPSLYARTAIPQGRLLTEEDLEVRVAPTPLDEALKPDQALTVAGMEASRDIVLGQRVTPAILARPFAVRRGDSIRAVSEAGVIRLAIEALAMQSGRTGDVIPIENKSNKRILRATVTAPGQARILDEGYENEKPDRVGVAAGPKHAGGQKKPTAEADAARRADREPVGGAPGVDDIARQPL